MREFVRAVSAEIVGWFRLRSQAMGAEDLAD